jgi:hypothetical protein
MCLAIILILWTGIEIILFFSKKYKSDEMKGKYLR